MTDVSVLCLYARMEETRLVRDVWPGYLLRGAQEGRRRVGMSVLGFEEVEGTSKWMGRRKWIGECSEDYALPVLRGGKAAVIVGQPAISAGNEPE